MSHSENCTLTLSYNGSLSRISFPEGTKYEQIIQMAMAVFQIPAELVDLVNISSGEQYMFTKEAFENYLMLYPEPEIILTILLCDSVQGFAMGPPRWQRMYGYPGPMTPHDPNLNGQMPNYY